jgi:hypothetical protein
MAMLTHYKKFSCPPDPTTGVSYTSAIQSDGKGDYVNGQSGVTALLRTCGTGDATLQTGKRSFTFDFNTVVDTNSSTP